MEFEVFGDESDPDLLWVMGWGNRADSRHERWFVDELVDAGYRVHTAQVPDNGTDFEAEYVEPVRSYRESIGDHHLVSHSTGGLVVAHLQPAEPVVYLSPWWGMSEGTPTIAKLLFRLPIATPFVPVPTDPGAIGGLATDEDLVGPDRISPAWIRTIRGAQDALPAIDEDDVVFYSPDDRVVSPAAIEAHAREEQRHPYEGGHEFFASPDRESILEDVLAAIRDAG